MKSAPFFTLAPVVSISSLARPIAAADVQLADAAPPPKQPLSLGYRQPAPQWLQALPTGNGRMGAMVFWRRQPGRVAAQNFGSSEFGPINELLNRIEKIAA